MNNFVTKVKNFAICNTWIVYLAVMGLFLAETINPLNPKYLALVGVTFLLNLYKDKVRDKLKEVERNL
jgi:hypothetical protein